MSPPIKFSSWMLLRLGLEAAQHHAAADDDRLALMDVASPVEYRAELARIYGFEAAVEAALVDHLESRGDAKTHLLRRDLLVLGMRETEVDRLPRAAVRLASATHALGWQFVIERHTLLAGLIRRQLEYRLGSQLDGATSYLAAYGDMPGARFRSLCGALDDHAGRMPSHPTLIVVAANEAFRAQRQWYQAERESALKPVGIATERSTLSI